MPEVTAQEALALVADGGYLLDVREQSEWDEGHAPQAVLVPLSELADRVDEIPTDRDVLVVCHSGIEEAAPPPRDALTMPTPRPRPRHGPGPPACGRRAS
jgi:rhodanese-related sulfurtransferase